MCEIYLEIPAQKSFRDNRAGKGTETRFSNKFDGPHIPLQCYQNKSDPFCFRVTGKYQVYSQIPLIFTSTVIRSLKSEKRDNVSQQIHSSIHGENELVRQR